MKTILLALIFLASVANSLGQMTSSAVEIVTVYSENERFYLKSIPSDNETPSLRGRTSIFQVGNPVPLYSVNRGFASLMTPDNGLVLSDDGETILYVITYEDEDKDGLRSINIYRKGQLVKSFTKSQLTVCDDTKDCDLIYRNLEEVIDNEKSYDGTGSYKPIFKEGGDDRERFLFKYALFSADDLVYITDSKKQVHIFDLRT